MYIGLLSILFKELYLLEISMADVVRNIHIIVRIWRAIETYKFYIFAQNLANQT